MSKISIATIASHAEMSIPAGLHRNGRRGPSPVWQTGRRFHMAAAVRWQVSMRLSDSTDASGELLRTEGHCQSSCTMFLAIRNVCVDPNANLLFHAALSRHERDHAPYPERNAHMASHYNSSLRAFVLANHYMDSFTFHPISGRDIIRKFGYRQCSRK